MALHPALALVRGAVRRALADLDPGTTVMVACSGGADSLALLSAAVFEGHKAALKVVGVTVDHGLQEGSVAHAAAVSDQMRALGVDESAVATVTVDAPGMGPEAAAREARYGVLGELAERFDASVVLLGHTLDDQAETVLLGLTRGSGARSLAGMRPGFDRFRRPLLQVTRTDTETACTVEGIEWWTDPHNSDSRFTRSRIRTVVLPVLEEELGPGVAASLARTADLLREDAEALDDEASRRLDDLRSDQGLEVTALGALPAAVRHRVVRLVSLEAGAIASELTRGHVLAVAAMALGAEGGKQIQLPGHVTAYRVGTTLRFRRTGADPM
jgi:tRNA(Ile)-lysidine synthase